MSQERVQKILARAGIASRRQAEELITEGVVTINGKTAQLGDRATWGEDAIKVRGKLITAVEAPVYFAFHKPKNVISMMSDPEGRPTLADYFSKVKQRLFPVGRLDFTSEGLLLLTNDGKFAEELQRRDDIPKVYHVKVKGHPDAEMLSRLERGMKIENRFVKPFSVRVRDEYTQKALVEIVMLGSGAFDVKSYCESKGYLVEKITRASIGHLTLHGMKASEYRLLKKSQVEALLHQPELGMKKIEQELSDAKEVAAARAKRDAKAAERAEQAAAKTERVAARAGAVKKVVIAPVSGGAKRPARASAASMEGKLTRGSFGGDRARDERTAKVRAERDERPARSFDGDRPARTFGDRPARSFGDGPKKSFGDRPKRGFGADRAERPARSFGGDRPARAPRSDSGFGVVKSARSEVSERSAPRVPKPLGDHVVSARPAKRGANGRPAKRGRAKF